jgi:ubiquinone/menaquinone biosynthesis C-methylase UbiE
MAQNILATMAKYLGVKNHLLETVDHSKHAAEVFNKWADVYQTRFMDVSAYATALDLFINLLPHPSSSVLEIACGPGNITKYVLSKKPDLNIHGIDLAPNMVDLARLNCPGATFEVMDCRHVNTLTKKFDGIIAGFCLPYLNQFEVEDLIRDISLLLNEGGSLYISTIEDSFLKSGLKKGSTGDELFTYYYELKDIESPLSKYGLKIISQKRVSVSGNPHHDIDLLLVAVKQHGL